MSTAAASSSSAEALLVEHLRYTPLSLIDDVINTINAIVYRAVTAIEQGLLETRPAALGFDDEQEQQNADPSSSSSSSPPSTADRHRVEVEDGVHRLETLLEATVDKTFDRFEIYTLRNILRVPDDLHAWVRLRHYDGLNFHPSKDAATPESITHLRRKLQATQQLNLTLSHTHASNELLLQQLRQTLSSPTGQLAHLQAAGSSLPTPASTTAATTAPAPPSLQPAAQFTRSQIPALKAILDDLRPRLRAVSELAEAGARPGQHADRRDERVRYVDRVVDRVVSTHLGATRDPNDDDDDLGQRRGDDEVATIERVVADTAAARAAAPRSRRSTRGKGSRDEDHDMGE